jgi:hypothetical protein
VIALVDMATQFCCAANLDRSHHTKLTKGHLMTVKLAISRSKRPKDIGYL